MRRGAGTWRFVPAAKHLFDLTATDDLIVRMSAKGLHISGLVNNAGYGHPGMYLDSSWEDHAKFIQLMMTAPCELAHKLSPAMVGLRA